MTKTIAVVGATGVQGGSVVDALLSGSKVRVRALTRNPGSPAAVALAERGCEVARADLNDRASLERAFTDAYGVYLVTNAWEPDSPNEYEQGRRGVAAAKAAGVQHLVWSTLPNCHEISNGRFPVRHFTDKARVDASVEAAGFAFHTFVEAPMYFQNLTRPFMAPQPQPDGSKAWAFPMSVDAKCIHNGDIRNLGLLVARIFDNPDKCGKGQHLAMTPGLMCWQEIVDILNRQGHNITYRQLSNEAFEALPFPGAREAREMFNFWEEYTYFGPHAHEKIALANELVPEGFTSFADWAQEHMRAASGAADLTSAVLERHFRAVMEGDWETFENNLAKNAVLLTPHGCAQGHRDVRRVFEHARRHMTPDHIRAIEQVRRSVHDGVGYLVYRAEPFVSMGVDVWVVDEGKLLAQTYTAHPPLPYVKSFIEEHFTRDSDPTDATTANTKLVVDRHLGALGNLDAMLDNLAEDVVFITQAGILEGREQIRRAFTSGVQLAPNGYGKAVETLHRAHDGRVGYLVYRAEPYVSLGTDTWIVRGDEIAIWAYAAQPMLSNLPAWLDAAKH